MAERRRRGGGGRGGGVLVGESRVWAPQISVLVTRICADTLF